MNKFFTLLGLAVCSVGFGQEKGVSDSVLNRLAVPNGISFITDGNTPRVNITENNGNVGIGTLDPKAKLDVNGSISSVGDGSIGFGTRDAFDYGNQKVAHYGLTKENKIDNKVFLSGYGGLKFFTKGNPKMTVTESGNVGIGIENSNVKLGVAGTISSEGYSSIGFNTYDAFKYKNQDVAHYGLTRVGNEVVLAGWDELAFVARGHSRMAVSGMGVVMGRDENSWIFHNSGKTLYIAPRLSKTDWSWGAQVTLAPSGNVGIGGVYEPNERLVVNGNIISNGRLLASNVHISGTPTADFVFANDYKLRSLEETEKFIKENRHLPEIASAKEMEKEGVNVGAFQIQLLQKIEELTLYSIEQNKKILQLEDQNKELSIQSSEIKDLKAQLSILLESINKQ